jgi:hypothetical protein
MSWTVVWAGGRTQGMLHSEADVLREILASYGVEAELLEDADAPLSGPPPEKREFLHWRPDMSPRELDPEDQA